MREYDCPGSRGAERVKAPSLIELLSTTPLDDSHSVSVQVEALVRASPLFVTVQPTCRLVPDCAVDGAVTVVTCKSATPNPLGGFLVIVMGTAAEILLVSSLSVMVLSASATRKRLYEPAGVASGIAKLTLD